LLTLEQCRRILGNDLQVSDEELLELRQQLYSLAMLAMELADSVPEARSGTAVEGE
jgi:hypothetical protein